MKRWFYVTAALIAVVAAAVIVISFVIYPDRDRDQFCLAWFADCEVEWNGVAAVVSSIAVFAAVFAAVQARRAADDAWRIDSARTTRRDAEKRNRRELFRDVLESELRGAIDSKRLLFEHSDNLQPLQKLQFAVDNRQGLELTIASSHLSELDVFPADIAKWIAGAVIQSRALQLTLDPNHLADFLKTDTRADLVASIADSTYRRIGTFETHCELALRALGWLDMQRPQTTLPTDSPK